VAVFHLRFSSKSYRGFFDKIKKIFARPTNAPIGPVPGFNPDLVPLITAAKRTKYNFYIPTEAEYTDLLEHLLVVAYGTAAAIENAPKGTQFLASQACFSWVTFMTVSPISVVKTGSVSFLVHYARRRSCQTFRTTVNFCSRRRTVHKK
jgi:hypothetical protein